MKLETLPDTEKTVTLIDAERIAFVRVMLDSDSECPNDWDGPKLYSFSRRHSNFIESHKVEAFDPKRVVTLSYYEHGASEWSVRGEGYLCAFDSVEYAGIIHFPPESWPEIPEGGFIEAARSYCKTFNAWANGEVYGYRVTIHNLVNDQFGEAIHAKAYYEDRAPISDDSCFGYFNDDGGEYLLSEINAALGAEVTV